MKHPLPTNPSTRADRLATIWSIVEARKPLPATIVITAATALDDTESIARGLAQAAHNAGQQTGYLQLASATSGGHPAQAYATLSIDPRGSQREAFDAALATWRTMYDVIIVDASAAGSQALAAHSARLADGVVIALCDGRRVVEADRNLARLLDELHAPVIGVVTTAAFARSAASVPLVRERPVFERAPQP